MYLSIPKIPEPLVIWEKIEILTSTDANAGLYVTRIEDFIDGGMVVIQPELIKGEVLLRDNSDVLIHITKADAIYRYQSTIHKQKKDNCIVFFLSKPMFIKRIQRRKFARLVYSTPIEYTLFNELYNNDPTWYSSYTWNVSGNGILMEAKDHIKEDSIVLLRINLFNELNINLPILGRSHRIILDNHTRLSGISFIRSSEMLGYKQKYPIHRIQSLEDNFNNIAQEKLVAFVFSQQIEQRKKGLI